MGENAAIIMVNEPQNPAANTDPAELNAMALLLKEVRLVRGMRSKYYYFNKGTNFNELMSNSLKHILNKNY